MTNVLGPATIPTWATQVLAASPTATQLAAGALQMDDKMKERYNRYPLLKPVDLTLKRRLAQPRFKFPLEAFTSSDDIYRRIQNTVVCVGPQPILIREMAHFDNEWWLLAHDDQGRTWRLEYGKTDQLDLRAPEPQYIQYQNWTGYVIRKPTRQQHQGTCPTNTYIAMTGGNGTQPLHDLYEFMKALSDADTHLWSPTYADLMLKMRAMPALRLSNHVAFYRHETGINAEYKGRYLGSVHDDEIIVGDDEDMKKSWIMRDIAQIGCSMKAK